MKREETKGFFNEGFGWVCKSCAAGLPVSNEGGTAESRILNEGEAETKNPQLSTSALAQWRDKQRRTLGCPQCGTEELIGD